jgi:hypothetical protein
LVFERGEELAVALSASAATGEEKGNVGADPLSDGGELVVRDRLEPSFCGAKNSGGVGAAAAEAGLGGDVLDEAELQVGQVAELAEEAERFENGVIGLLGEISGFGALDRQARVAGFDPELITKDDGLELGVKGVVAGGVGGLDAEEAIELSGASDEELQNL